MALVEGPREVVAAWDTDGQIYFAKIEPGMTRFSKPQSVPGVGRGRKHPVLAAGVEGEILLAWTEGTGWQKGGALAWQLFDTNGNPTPEKGIIHRAIPVWGLPAAVATEAGFTILY